MDKLLMPFEAGRRFKPPISGQRASQLVDDGQLEAVRTESGRRLILASSVERLIKQREAARAAKENQSTAQ
jgi:hypothetical protein